MQRLTIEIATVPFDVELPDGALAQVLGQAWGDFRCSPRSGALSIHFTADSREIPGGVRSMPTGVGPLITGSGFEAVISGTHVEVVGALERFGVESALKLMLARALLPRGGLLVHSVALAATAAAAVLVGESGAGKSTLGRLGTAGGLRCLADELVVLMDGTAHGTPWNTGLAAAAKVRLLGTLGWAAAPRLEPVAPSDFLPLVLSNTLLPDEAPAARVAVFQLATKLLGAHPATRFFFPPDASAIEFLRPQLE